MQIDWTEGTVLCCRGCDELAQHYSRPPVHVVCDNCGRLTHILTLVVTYCLHNDDENPATLQLPQRLVMLTKAARGG